MAVSEVHICNMALGSLGAEQINALTENSQAARWCNIFYETNRDACLVLHNWNGVTKRATLARLSAAPAWGYQYKYQLPSDCLRVWRAKATASEDDDTGEIEYKVEGRELLTDEENVYIKYIARETDPTKYPPLVIEVMAARLSWLLAYPVARSSSLQQEKLKEFDMILAEARRIDAMEGTAEQIKESDSWLTARN